MIENLIGKRYAEALSGSIGDAAQSNTVLGNLKALQGAFETQDRLGRFFAHPGIPPEKKNALIEELCGHLQVEDVVRKLMLLLSERKKILFLKNIVEYFEKVVDSRLNQIRVSVFSASPLAPEDIGRLKSSLGDIWGKTVLIESSVDESLIGGIQLRVGDQVADATIKNQLALLKQTIEEEVT